MKVHIFGRITYLTSKCVNLIRYVLQTFLLQNLNLSSDQNSNAQSGSRVDQVFHVNPEIYFGIFHATSMEINMAVNAEYIVKPFLRAPGEQTPV